MSKILLSLFAAVALSVPSIALACPGHAKGEAGAACANCDKGKAGGCPHARSPKGEGEAGAACANCDKCNSGECPYAKGEAGAACANCDECNSGECPYAKGAKGEGASGCAHHKNADRAGKEGDCACEHGKKEKQASAWKEITVEQLASLDKGKVAIFDVNNAKVRGDKGVIPGAVLLSSSSQYDLSVLPKAKDSKLVFYCANTRCTAAPTAAERAIGAGYSDVNVLHVGISGWKEAGKKTDAPRS